MAWAFAGDLGLGGGGRCWRQVKAAESDLVTVLEATDCIRLNAPKAFSWRIKGRKIQGTRDKESGSTAAKGEADESKGVAMLTHRRGESGLHWLCQLLAHLASFGQVRTQSRGFLVLPSFLSALASSRHPGLLTLDQSLILSGNYHLISSLISPLCGNDTND